MGYVLVVLVGADRVFIVRSWDVRGIVCARAKVVGWELEYACVIEYIVLLKWGVVIGG